MIRLRAAGVLPGRHIMLSDGVRLFDRPGGTSVKLERLSLTHAPLATNLRMRVVQ